MMPYYISKADVFLLLEEEKKGQRSLNVKYPHIQPLSL
jgi:hypothetical protein